MASRSYKDLIVWQKAIRLVKKIYLLTENFPKSEMFGLTSQMRRCAVSIASNIAEGSKRRTKKDFNQFLLIAYGSGAELETQILIAIELCFITKKEAQLSSDLLEEIMKMLNKMTSL